MGLARSVFAIALVLTPCASVAQEVAPVVSSMDLPTSLLDDPPIDPQDIRAPSALPLPQAEEVSRLAPGVSRRPETRQTWEIQAARWDDHPQGQRWSQTVMAALRGHGAPLLEVVPRDIAQWCPGYVTADPAGRAAFWNGLVSTLAWHESTHRPQAVGGGGRWFGLVQIAPGTARYRQCNVRSGQALLNGPANLSCGIRIMAETVPRDGVIAHNMQGVAADWGPFHSRRKREDMRNWVIRQDYCQTARRPEPRPSEFLMRTIAPSVAALAPLQSQAPTQRP